MLITLICMLINIFVKYQTLISINLKQYLNLLNHIDLHDICVV